MTEPSRPYEFDHAQNATFAKLAGAMTFVAVAMLVLSALAALTAAVLARSTLAGSAVVAPLAIAVAFMGVQLFAAARRFRRIVATHGNDVSHLIAALDEMAVAYSVQRWLWITASMVIVAALAFTIVGR